MKAFISYSHKDAAALERLHDHLKVLRQEGHIDTWFDREILAGGEIDAEIEERIESSELFLLLVSPDFLASDYCVEKEMKMALGRHHSDDAKVVPIIIEPCDWAHTALGNLKALPRDGKPISEWPNKNSAYLDVVQELRRVLDKGTVLSPEGNKVPLRPRQPNSGARGFRIKRDFDEIDRGDFCDQAFLVIRDYFQGSISKIDTVEELRARFDSRSATSFTCTVVNRALQRGTAHITVHRGGDNTAIGDIYYSFTKNAPTNAANGILYVQADEYELYLSSLHLRDPSGSDRLSAETVAQLMWEEFLGKAGVSYD